LGKEYVRMVVEVGGWMDGWMDGWTDGLMDGADSVQS
jgi:hypothetical protein